MIDRGFWATLIGGVIGGAIGVYVGALFGWVGLAWLGVGSSGESYDEFFYVAVSAAIGAWLGCLAGAYGGLRLARADRVRATIGSLAVVAPTLVGGATWLGVSWTDADDYGSNFIPYVIFITSVIGTAYLARRLAAASSQGTNTA